MALLGYCGGVTGPGGAGGRGEGRGRQCEEGVGPGLTLPPVTWSSEVPRAPTSAAPAQVGVSMCPPESLEASQRRCSCWFRSLILALMGGRTCRSTMSWGQAGSPGLPLSPSQPFI